MCPYSMGHWFDSVNSNKASRSSIDTEQPMSLEGMVSFDENMNKEKSQRDVELISPILLTWQLWKLALDFPNFYGITLPKTTVAFYWW